MEQVSNQGKVGVGKATTKDVFEGYKSHVPRWLISFVVALRKVYVDHFMLSRTIRKKSQG
ncbi:hypothetical protein ccbrp13_23510 [Ktedonobacteria bacterium brp13]|nr:hypothetical protein ccbrp13_23510 [Ktedonobacteria bacterium brp13]